MNGSSVKMSFHLGGRTMIRSNWLNLARTANPITVGCGLGVLFTMTSMPELTDLFARLASHLNDTSLPHHTTKQVQNEAALDLSISELNHSLNLNDNSRVRVLDTVLSLMCFKAPQVSSLKLLIFRKQKLFI